MEHNAEKIIQQKIKEAEQAPVTWDKERVWSSINKPALAESKRPTFYYAAASVFLAGALIIYSTQLTHRKELDKQIRLIELAIEKQVSMVNSADAPACSMNDAKKSASEYFLETKVDEQIEPNEQIQIYLMLPSQRNDFSDSASLIELTDTGITEPVTVIQNNVEPIIRDYLPEQNVNAVAGRNNRRMKVRFFDTPEMKPLDAGERTSFILARIK